MCCVKAAPSLVDVDLEGCSLVTDMTVLEKQRYAVDSKHGIQPATDAASCRSEGRLLRAPPPRTPIPDLGLLRLAPKVVLPALCDGGKRVLL